MTQLAILMLVGQEVIGKWWSWMVTDNCFEWVILINLNMIKVCGLCSEQVLSEFHKYFASYDQSMDWRDFLLWQKLPLWYGRIFKSREIRIISKIRIELQIFSLLISFAVENVANNCFCGQWWTPREASKPSQGTTYFIYL